MPVCGCFAIRVFRYASVLLCRYAGRCAVVSLCRCLGFLAFHGIQSFAVIILLIACTVNDILIITCLVIVECGITTDDYKQCKVTVNTT